MRTSIGGILLLAAACRLLGQELKLKATVVTPSAVLESAVVGIRGERITAVTVSTVDSEQPQAIALDGVIFPGLIDLHNHLTWNVLPNWKPPKLYTNRYEWQEAPEYAQALSGPYAVMIANGAGCDMNRFGEVKSIVNGGTTTVGSYSPTTVEPQRNQCIAGLARNADYASGLAPTLNQERYRNFVFPFELPPGDEQLLRTANPEATDPNVIRGAAVHLAEGTDSAARREFRMFKAHGYLRKGVTVIHGTALAPEQIRELAEGGVGFIWSPKSNFVLYGQTADVLTATQAGMTVALAPDWSPTGSAGMLEELGIAYRHSLGRWGGALSEAALVQMATLNPARLAGLEQHLGSVEPGKLADLVLMRRQGKTAYQSLLLGTPGDVQLVLIAGQPVYGDAALMQRLLPGAPLEALTVCGEPKALHIVDDAASDQSWKRVTERLRHVMRPMGLAPSALASCAP